MESTFQPLSQVLKEFDGANPLIGIKKKIEKNKKDSRRFTIDLNDLSRYQVNFFSSGPFTICTILDSNDRNFIRAGATRRHTHCKKGDKNNNITGRAFSLARALWTCTARKIVGPPTITKSAVQIGSKLTYIPGSDLESAIINQEKDEHQQIP